MGAHFSILGFIDHQFSSLNFPAGGLFRLPDSKWIDWVGQVSMQVLHAKQSGVTCSCFRMAFITVQGQALAHASQAIQVS